MAYQTAASAMTLNDLQGHSQAFLNAIRRTFLQYFARSQLTLYARGPYVS